jgi:hypothetical protein
VKYTKEMVEDITTREKKGLEALKELQLTPSAAVAKINLGNDTFADKVTPYLADTKYQDILSPLQEKEVKNKK